MAPFSIYFIASGIPASALNDAVWDHVFLDGPYPEGCGIAKEALQAMRDEFNFWWASSHFLIIILSMLDAQLCLGKQACHFPSI